MLRPAGGEVRGVYRKRFLPNYGVFDEDRYFAPGRDLLLLALGDDARRADDLRGHLAAGAARDRPRARRRAADREHLRLAVPRRQGPRARGDARVRARDNSCFVAFCNAVGGQDELIFDGHSVVLDDEGEVVARAPGFEEALLVVDLDPVAAVGRRLRDVRRRALAQERATPPPVVGRAIGVAAGRRRAARTLGGAIAPQLDDLEQMRLALELGLRDYVEKNGFGDVVIGLSGGIDSALTAALAVEALGPERVHGVSMPSRYSSEATRRDARALAESLGATSASSRSSRSSRRSRPCSPPSFAGREPDLAEENLQARIRGTLLMALSNKFGWLVIATGNKSELSVGYATLYGDIAGGFALLKDVYKTDVFRLARHLNERAGRELIPQSIIDRAPSAELRADQLDEDSLPPYAAARPGARGVRRARPLARGALRGRLRRGRRRARARDDRPRRVQAPPGAARREAPPEGVRPRPPHADHEPLARLAADVDRRVGRAVRDQVAQVCLKRARGELVLAARELVERPPAVLFTSCGTGEQRVVRGRAHVPDIAHASERELLARVVDLTLGGPEPDVAAGPDPWAEVDVGELQLFRKLPAKRVFR